MHALTLGALIVAGFAYVFGYHNDPYPYLVAPAREIFLWAVIMLGFLVAVRFMRKVQRPEEVARWCLLGTVGWGLVALGFAGDLTPRLASTMFYIFLALFFIAMVIAMMRPRGRELEEGTG